MEGKPFDGFVFVSITQRIAYDSLHKSLTVYGWNKRARLNNVQLKTTKVEELREKSSVSI